MYQRSSSRSSGGAIVLQLAVTLAALAVISACLPFFTHTQKEHCSVGSSLKNVDSITACLRQQQQQQQSQQPRDAHDESDTRARLAQIAFCWSQRLTYNHAAKLANTITQKKAGEGQRKDPVNAFVTIVSQFTVI